MKFNMLVVEHLVEKLMALALGLIELACGTVLYRQWRSTQPAE